MATALPQEKVEQAIERLRPKWRRLARSWFHKTVTLIRDGKQVRTQNWYRRGSDSFARRYPHLAVDDKQRELIWNLQKEGCSLRELEEIFHLQPQQGNDAYRNCKMHEAVLMSGMPRKRKPKLRLNAAQIKALVEDYIPRDKKDIAHFKQIEVLIERKLQVPVS